MTEYSKHQKGIIKRYYDNRDTLALQKLGELVSNLYLETNAAKIKRSWKSVRTQMLAAGIREKLVDEIVTDQDLGAVAKVISEQG